ncbi:MAG: S1-like domain-containing RNA-binding protein [Gammaproteobacteria bacterium]|jgi:predicted RNA-binding protein (virulence factor B family)|nr:S1-like domain-containing RNA-binding protein [Gammaproteobacteria bacterium]
MIETGRFNQLEIAEITDVGLFLVAGEGRTLFLPIEQVDRTYRPGDTLAVFVFVDADGNPVATTRRPAAELGQVAWLEIVEVNDLGAFANWGLPKDLFIPFAEQQHKLRKGQHALVKIYTDKQGRIAGSTRVDHWVKDDASGLGVGDQVSLLIADETELGVKAIINHRSWGLLYRNELFRQLRKGQQVTGYIKQVRPDDKIDLSLEKPGFSKGRLDTLGERIIEQLEAGGGQLALTDKSPPDAIYATFGVSKKVFKQALGALYKQRRITLHEQYIKLAV